MLNDYMIVHKSILPDYYEKVIAVRKLLESGKFRNVTDACREQNISRSTYYKYKDYLFEPNEKGSQRKAVIAMILSHQAGILSNVLDVISKSGISIISISQAAPVSDKASVISSLDISDFSFPINELVDRLKSVEGVISAELVSLE